MSPSAPRWLRRLGHDARDANFLALIRSIDIDGVAATFDCDGADTSGRRRQRVRRTGRHAVSSEICRAGRPARYVIP